MFDELLVLPEPRLDCDRRERPAVQGLQIAGREISIRVVQRLRFSQRRWSPTTATLLSTANLPSNSARLIVALCMTHRGHAPAAWVEARSVPDHLEAGPLKIPAPRRPGQAVRRRARHRINEHLAL